VRRTCRAWAAASLAILVLAAASPSAQSAGTAAPTVRLRGRFAAGEVERALAGARRRLERPGCQRLFAEFSDDDGRPLADALEAEGTSGSEHLGRVLFYDGEGHPQCERDTTLAFTTRGSGVVLVCAPRFIAVSRRDPNLAEAALIHEALHTLGLGENPPTSAEITARVLNRCPD
jgi:hypothetical protein